MKNTRSVSAQDTTLCYLLKISKIMIFDYIIIKISKNKKSKKFILSNEKANELVESPCIHHTYIYTNI